MTKVIIEGVHGLDGEYEADLSHFSNREWRLIKEIAGVRMGEFEEAIKAIDNDLVVALTVITLRRNGREPNIEALWDAESGKIRMIADRDEEEDALPPASEPADSENGSGPGPSSASPSDESGDATLVAIPIPIGTQD